MSLYEFCVTFAWSAALSVVGAFFCVGMISVFERIESWTAKKKLINSIKVDEKGNVIIE